MEFIDISDGQNQGFSLQDFGEALGNTATSVVDSFGNTLDANGINSLAIANLNQAKADEIRSNAENRKQITKSIFTILIVAILVVGIISVVNKFWVK